MELTPDAPPPESDPRGDTDRAALAQDWRDIWRSELQALAVDAEFGEAIDAAARLCAGPVAPPPEANHRTGSAAALTGYAARADAAPRSASLAAASDPRDLAIERLERRVAQLEQRLARLDASGGDAGDASGLDAGGG